MTKKHFIAFAARMKDDLEASKRFGDVEYKRTYDAVTYASHAFADIASRDNGRFDRDKFIAACGLR